MEVMQLRLPRRGDACSRNASFEPQRTPLEAGSEKLQNKRRVGTYIRRSQLAQFWLQSRVHLRQLVPRNSRVKMVFKVKVFVAHEETNQRRSQDCSRSKNLVIGRFQ